MHKHAHTGATYYVGVYTFSGAYKCTVSRYGGPLRQYRARWYILLSGAPSLHHLIIMTEQSLSCLLCFLCMLAIPIFPFLEFTCTYSHVLYFMRTYAYIMFDVVAGLHPSANSGNATIYTSHAVCCYVLMSSHNYVHVMQCIRLSLA